MKKLFWTGAAVTWICSLLWLANLSWRLLGTGLSQDPAAAVFDPSMAVSFHQAVLQGYGMTAFLHILVSLADWSSLAAAAGILMMGVAAAGKYRKLKRLALHQETRIHELQASNRILSHRLASRELDTKEQREGCENLAHQLKSSLNSLTLRLELQGFEKEAEESLIHMNDQIDSFLRQSVIRCNEPGLRLSVVSLKSLMETVLEKTSGYSIQTITSLQPAWLYGDAEVLERACEALIVNAFRHGKGHPVTISLEEKSASILLTVMNHTDLKVLPDFRRYRTSEPGHYGIGQDLARTAAKQHGGTLSFSLSGSSLTATLSLPVIPWESETAKFLQAPDDEISLEVKS
ncbi:sensor histidine kinase [Faecalibaculum rodentium]|uniref:sensor histidine kinase n=1 Tax=Faecalibaculum rodentium TaxID=1702221 RepID=UPI0023F4F863|nr:ATP-binding protein [Faecalibaculum rodentium]